MQITANMGGSRFRSPNNSDEGAAWLQEALPEIQEHNITWWPSVKTFEEWQSARLNELLARNEEVGYAKVNEVGGR